MSIINKIKWLKRSRLSFSQSGEDLIVEYIFKSLKQKELSYLDIGAHNPFKFSNTAKFYIKGFRGVCIEPDPELYKEFIKLRPKDNCLNIGIANEKKILEFYKISASTLNTFSQESALDYEKKGYKVVKKLNIQVDTINNILQKYFEDRTPDFISIDVEGLDNEIVYSMDFKKFYPKVLCVETLTFEEKGKGIKDHKIIDYLRSKGYFLYADTYINSILVRKDIWIRN